MMRNEKTFDPKSKMRIENDCQLRTLLFLALLAVTAATTPQRDHGSLPQASVCCRCTWRPPAGYQPANSTLTTNVTNNVTTKSCEEACGPIYIDLLGGCYCDVAGCDSKCNDGGYVYWTGLCVSPGGYECAGSCYCVGTWTLVNATSEPTCDSMVLKEDK